MSLLGETTAFPVIGISCQPALQLYRNREHVSALLGEPMAYKSSFFNWMMFSADEVPRLLERMISEPITAQSIDLPPGERVPVLRGHRAWLFHEGPNYKYTSEKLRALASKYEYLRQNFLMLCARPVRYFVLCNAQNNLVPDHPHLSARMELRLDAGLIAEVRATVERLFPRGRNHLLVVGRRDLVASAALDRIWIPPVDDTVWEGSTAAWADILSDCVDARRVPATPVGAGR